MFYFPEELNSQIIEIACEVSDQVLIPMFEKLGIKATVTKDDVISNTEEYQDCFEVFYDYITNTLYGVHRGDKHIPRTDLPFPKSLEEMDNRPEINNLINIFSALSEDLPQNVVAQYVGKDFKFFKEDLSDLVNQKISNISTEMHKLLKDLNYLDLILKKGCQKANEIAEKNVKDLKKIIGFFEAWVFIFQSLKFK